MARNNAGTSQRIFITDRHNPKGGNESETRQVLVCDDMITETTLDKDNKPVKKLRRIRYIPNQTSIYFDEQGPEPDKLKAYRLVFQKGIMYVSADKINLVDFLLKCNFNGTNPGRDSSKLVIFTELDMVRSAKKYVAEAQNNSAMQFRAAHMPFEDCKMFAYALATSVDQIKKLEVADPDQIRQYVISVANADPKKFMSVLNDKDIKRQAVMFKGLTSAIIYYNPVTRDFSWDESKSVFLNCPLGISNVKEAVKYFVDSIEQIDKIAEVYELIKDKVKMDVAESLDKKEDRIEAFVREAIEKKVIEARKGSFYAFEGANIAQGMAKLTEELRNNTELRHKIDEALMKAEDILA